MADGITQMAINLGPVNLDQVKPTEANPAAPIAAAGVADKVHLAF
jgi:hypothetical protein